MKSIIVTVLVCVYLLNGCQKQNDVAHGFATPKEGTNLITNVALSEIVNPDYAAMRKNVLAQMEEISCLWTTNVWKAYRKTASFAKEVPIDVFNDSEMCRQYVSFVRDLRFDAIPVETRKDCINLTFIELINAFHRSTQANIQNLEYACVLSADYVEKLRQEYESICSQIEQEIQTNDESMSVTNVLGEGDNQCLKACEQQMFFCCVENRKSDLLMSYKRHLSFWIERYLSRGFDSEYRRQKVEKVPEPKRTELINYIERKIGRPMKWRSVGVH